MNNHAADRAPRYIVQITTDPETAVSGFEDGAGTEAYGPYDYETALAVWNAITAEFAKHKDKEFLYGEASVEIVRCFTHTPSPEEAVKNWVDPDYKNTIKSLGEWS